MYTNETMFNHLIVRGGEGEGDGGRGRGESYASDYQSYSLLYGNKFATVLDNLSLKYYKINATRQCSLEQIWRGWGSDNNIGWRVSLLLSLHMKYYIYRNNTNACHFSPNAARMPHQQNKWSPVLAWIIYIDEV